MIAVVEVYKPQSGHKPVPDEERERHVSRNGKTLLCGASTDGLKVQTDYDVKWSTEVCPECVAQAKVGAAALAKVMKAVDRQVAVLEKDYGAALEFGGVNAALKKLRSASQSLLEEARTRALDEVTA